MSLVTSNFSKLKKTSLYYKLAYLRKKKNEKKLISWSFLVVNSSSDIASNFLSRLKQLNFDVKRKKIFGFQNSNVKKFRLKGILLSVDFLNIECFSDFFAFYYPQIDSLIFNIKTLGFFYDKFFFSFINKKEFNDFRKGIVEPLKTKNFLPLVVQTINKFRSYVTISLNNFFVNFYLQLSSYKTILDEKQKN